MATTVGTMYAEIRATTAGLKRDMADAVQITRAGAREMSQVLDEFGKPAFMGITEGARRAQGPILSIDSSLRGLAKTSRGLVGPIASELGPAFDSIGIRMAHVLTTSTHLSTGMGSLAIAGAGVAAVLGGALLTALKKDAEEAANFQAALNSVDAGKIQGEMDRLIKKLDEASTKIRFLQGRAGDAGPAAPPTFQEFPDIGTSPLPGGVKERDKALEDLARAREAAKAAATDDGAASFTAFAKKQGDERVKAFEDAQKAEQDMLEKGRASMVAAVEAQLAEEEALAKQLLAIDEATFRAEQEQIAKGVASEVAAAQATIDETENEQLAIVRIDRERFAEEQQLIDAGVRSEVAAAEAIVQEHFNMTQELARIDEARAQAVREERDAFVSEFAEFNSQLGSAIGLALTGTQTVAQAFEQMGRSIAQSLIQNVVERGLKVVEQALFDFLKEAQETGLIKAAIKAGVGAGVALFSPSPGTGAGAGGDTFNSGVMTASGGVFRGAQWRVIGEAGAEAVIPLEHGSVPVDLEGGGSGGDTIIINNNTSAEVTHKSEQTPDGRKLHTFIISEVTRGFEGGEFDKVMGIFGNKRQPVAR